MEKGAQKSYESLSPLGYLYDNVSGNDTTFKPEWDHAFDQQVLQRYDLAPETLKQARQIKTQYDKAVRRVVAQLRLGSEFELWSGLGMSKPTVGTEYKRMEDLGNAMTTIRTLYRSLCHEAAGGSTPDKIDPFVAAMYKVTEEQTKIALFEHHRGPTNEAGEMVPARKLEASSMPLITFPWLFPEVMARIRTGEDLTQRKPWYANPRRRNKSNRPKSEGTVQKMDRSSSNE